MTSSPQLSEHDYLALIANGLQPKPSQPQRIAIVGAGMAGLVAAHELLKAGHDPIVLEAQSRVGGRVLTLRQPFADGLFAEAGAMRLPASHRLTMAYVDAFGLKTSPFTASNPKGYYLFNGHKVRIEQAQAAMAELGFELPAAEQTQPIMDMWERAIRPMADRLAADGDDAWASIISEHDQYSVREFLELQGWSESAIELFGLLANYEALMNSSFLELLREELGGFYRDLVYLDGGMDQLPRSFLPSVGDRIRYGARMVAIDQSNQGVTIHCRNESGRFSVQADYGILTVPFPVLRHVEVLQPFSRAKQRAIRQLHYDASAKVFLQAGRRFWEDDDGIIGGGSVTDLAIRNLYYPDHGRSTGRGVLLASYTWSEDAQRWGSLPEHERLTQAIENVAEIHPQIKDSFEAGASKMWHDDEFAGGAFALFDPGQQSLLHAAVMQPEGRIHFAGEHTSLAHAWIQGAIESGLRAAHEIHQRSA
jgi:monoamine oxidase